MDPQVHHRSNKQSNSHKNAKKANNKQFHPQSSFNFTQNNFNQKRGPVARETYSKNPSSYYNNSHHASWAVFNGKNNGKSNQILEKFDGYHSQHNYLKMSKSGYNKGYYSDMNYSKSTNASSNSDNEAQDVFSELTGFTVVQNGKTLVNENEKNLMRSEILMNQFAQAKFASSQMMVGPNAQEISIPVFAAEIEQIC
jgi:hypothetical protein